MEATRVRLRVSPGAKRAHVVGRHGDAWKVRVAAPPEGGRANDAIIRLVADTLALPRDAVALVAGHGSRDKTVELTGIDMSRAEARLATAAEEKR